MEKWTWDEINAGRRMSKPEKRMRRLAVGLGATKAPDGQIKPPTYDESPMYYAFFIGFIVLGLLAIILSALAQSSHR